VQADRLDNYADELVGLSFIKADCEGAEIDALSGADGLIAAHRSVISVEYGSLGYESFGYTADTLFEFALAHDMVIYDIFLNPLRDGPAWSSSVNLIYWDFLLIPAEKEDEMMAWLKPVNA
jgi:hypothetical protein